VVLARHSKDRVLRLGMASKRVSFLSAYGPLCMSALFLQICLKQLIVRNTSSNPSLRVKALMASLRLSW
jgi:hypothetical protein